MSEGSEGSPALSARSRRPAGGSEASPRGSPRMEIEAFAERLFSSRSDLVPVPAEHSSAFSFRTLFKFVGPGLLTSVAFVDPGNIESDLQAGSYAGYRLLWVVALSTLIGLLFQSFSARLGTATGKHLATHCSEQFGSKQVQALWLMTQIAIIGSDIQEIVGSAVAFRLLFGLPLWVGCLLTALDTLTFLGLHASGLRRLEAVFAVLILIMVVCFFANFILTTPEPSRIIEGIFVPSVSRKNAIQAASILGAVIMPHNIFLHSALVLSRDVDRSNPTAVRDASFYFTIEAGLALSVAFLINSAIVSVFAHGFFSHTCEGIEEPLILFRDGVKEYVEPPFACVPTENHAPYTSVACVTGFGSEGTCQPIGLQVAGKPLEALLGPAATTLWAIGLLAAGQSSTVTGTYAGQFVMEGMLDVTLPNWKRVAFTRMVALVPATLVAVLASRDYLAADRLDEWLNVLQSVQLPFALVPLLTCCGDGRIMGREFALGKWEKVFAWTIACIVVCINVVLLADRFHNGSRFIALIIVILGSAYLWLLKQFLPTSRPEKTSTSSTPGTADERKNLIEPNGNSFTTLYL